MARDAERAWAGDNAVDGSLDELRSWVVWGGGGTVPGEIAFEGTGNDIAEWIAAGRDPGWKNRDDRWVIVMRADEDDVDALRKENPSVMGYAPYLIEGREAEMPEEPMRGTLRSDVAPRRKAEPR